ncbi:hypothetical protein, partial [Pseudomonas viridiflava]|uniref:hypothetical protein n=1 Tax=Pseudomonas viridiflava TaxID=33069 RepID=UPI0019D25A40
MKNQPLNSGLTVNLNGDTTATTTGNRNPLSDKFCYPALRLTDQVGKVFFADHLAHVRKDQKHKSENAQRYKGPFD